VGGIFPTPPVPITFSAPGGLQHHRCKQRLSGYQRAIPNTTGASSLASMRAIPNTSSIGHYAGRSNTTGSKIRSSAACRLATEPATTSISTPPPSAGYAQVTTSNSLPRQWCKVGIGTSSRMLFWTLKIDNGLRLSMFAGVRPASRCIPTRTLVAAFFGNNGNEIEILIYF
jgi:hypothetical protein